MIINNLIKDEYQCMFLKDTNIKLGRRFHEVQIDASNFDDDKFLDYLKYRDITICFEKDGVGSLVFSNMIPDNPFEILQKSYRDLPSYYFWGSDTLSNFKILKDGKIQRKFAGKGYIKDGFVASEEQVLGKPCEYELKKNKIYKMTYNEYSVKISRQEMYEIFDFYVPFKRDENIKFDRIKFFVCVEGSNLKFSMENFSKPEFLQSLIHVGDNFEFESTKPLLIFKQTNVLRFAYFKDKCIARNIKNSKKLLNMGIFDKFNNKLTKTDLFFKPYYLTDYNFISYFADAIIESARIEENYKTTYSNYQNAFSTEGEYIGSESSLFYFIIQFIDGKLCVKMFAVLKNGIPVNHEFVAELNGFKKGDMIVFYQQVLDYIFGDNFAEKLDILKWLFICHFNADYI